MSVPAAAWPQGLQPNVGCLQLHLASAFGAFLDPVADKLMVCTALVLLGARPPAWLSQVS